MLWKQLRQIVPPCIGLLNVCEYSKVRCGPVVQSKHEAGASVYFGHISSYLIDRAFTLNKREPEQDKTKQYNLCAQRTHISLVIRPVGPVFAVRFMETFFRQERRRWSYWAQVILLVSAYLLWFLFEQTEMAFSIVLSICWMTYIPFFFSVYMYF